MDQPGLAPVSSSARRFASAVQRIERQYEDERNAVELEALRALREVAEQDSQRRWGSLVSDPRFTALGQWSGREAFVAGYRRGLDAAGAVAEGRTFTTPWSFWFSMICEVCSHSFRDGDPVVVVRAPDRPAQAVHDNPVLRCAAAFAGADSTPEAPATDARRRFRSALAREFPLPEGVRVSHVKPPRFGIDEPDRKDRRACEVCNATFRLAEGFVRCPCGLTKDLCWKAVHHDPGRGLLCYSKLTALPDFRDRCSNPAAAALRTTRGHR